MGLVDPSGYCPGADSAPDAQDWALIGQYGAKTTQMFAMAGALTGAYVNVFYGGGLGGGMNDLVNGAASGNWGQAAMGVVGLGGLGAVGAVADAAGAFGKYSKYSDEAGDFLKATDEAIGGSGGGGGEKHLVLGLASPAGRSPHWKLFQKVAFEEGVKPTFITDMSHYEARIEEADWIHFTLEGISPGLLHEKYAETYATTKEYQYLFKNWDRFHDRVIWHEIDKMIP